MAQSIGERVKTLRAEQKLTLAELADRAGVSPSYLSQVERDRTTPSLAALTAMARALDVQVRCFFETTDEAVFVTRAEDRAWASDGNEASWNLTPGSGASFTNVGGGPGQFCWAARLVPLGRTRLVVQRLQIPPGQASGNLSPAPGEAFLFVLSGRLCIDVGGESYSLGAGDSLHYDAAQPHAWRNDSPDLCSVIWGSAGGAPER